ncbi:MAG TPA: ATP-binding cassette domain-containing protein, partial [Rhodocyclaceae bacterium]|nr:ATP-binding cassette domain-containing protein [Rhodocyclaceae bacterium]
MSEGVAARFRILYAGFCLDVDLALPGRGVSALFGPSGSGKTTCLRAIAGLERAAGGFLTVNGDVWQDDASGIFIATHRRPVGYVFQEADLFPHLSVRKNLEYGWKRLPIKERRVHFDHVVELLGLDQFLERLPAKLSGGERQRVAIARSLLCSPRILLMDEPLA